MFVLGPIEYVLIVLIASFTFSLSVSNPAVICFASFPCPSSLGFVVVANSTTPTLIFGFLSNKLSTNFVAASYTTSALVFPPSSATLLTFILFEPSIKSTTSPISPSWCSTSTF